MENSPHCAEAGMSALPSLCLPPQYFLKPTRDAKPKTGLFRDSEASGGPIQVFSLAWEDVWPAAPALHALLISCHSAEPCNGPQADLSLRQVLQQHPKYFLDNHPKLIWCLRRSGGDTLSHGVWAVFIFFLSFFFLGWVHYRIHKPEPHILFFGWPLLKEQKRNMSGIIN